MRRPRSETTLRRPLREHHRERLRRPRRESPFEKTTITRRDLKPTDVLIDIKFAGICRSDIHTARDEWGEASYPLVPGHEIAGIVSEVGSEVGKYSVGDRVGVGCMVDSCRECENCRAGEEQYCLQGHVGTYGGVLDGRPTDGGYSEKIVVDEAFVLSQTLSKKDDGEKFGAQHYYDYYATSDEETVDKLAGSFDLIINPHHQPSSSTRRRRRCRCRATCRCSASTAPSSTSAPRRSRSRCPRSR